MVMKNLFSWPIKLTPLCVIHYAVAAILDQASCQSSLFPKQSVVHNSYKGPAMASLYKHVDIGLDDPEMILKNISQDPYIQNWRFVSIPQVGHYIGAKTSMRCADWSNCGACRGGSLDRGQSFG